MRLALAIARQFKENPESLTEFSDDEMLDRLFYRDGVKDSDFMEQAEVLALVYSYSIDNDGESESESELNKLGKIINQTDDDMYRATSRLKEREII